MSLVRTTIVITNDRIVQDHSDLLREFPQRTESVLNRTVKRVKNRVTQRFRQEPPRPRFAYGQFPWTSRRQQQAFHASNGFGRGIPTRRTHDLSKGWNLVIIPIPDRIPGIGIYNPIKYRKFVTGRYQQRFHAGRWLKERDMFREARKELASEATKDILNLFDEVTRP